MADVAGRARLLIRDAVNVVRTAASGAPHRQATARPIRGCGDTKGAWSPVPVASTRPSWPTISARVPPVPTSIP